MMMVMRACVCMCVCCYLWLWQRRHPERETMDQCARARKGLEARRPVLGRGGRRVVTGRVVQRGGDCAGAVLCCACCAVLCCVCRAVPGRACAQKTEAARAATGMQHVQGRGQSVSVSSGTRDGLVKRRRPMGIVPRPDPHVSRLSGSVGGTACAPQEARNAVVIGGRGGERGRRSLANGVEKGSWRRMREGWARDKGTNVKRRRFCPCGYTRCG